jgi:hypothetical protein
MSMGRSSGCSFRSGCSGSSAARAVGRGDPRRFRRVETTKLAATATESITSHPSTSSPVDTPTAPTIRANSE